MTGVARLKAKVKGHPSDLRTQHKGSVTGLGEGLTRVPWLTADLFPHGDSTVSPYTRG